jgi:hypothetical protein
MPHVAGQFQVSGGRFAASMNALELLVALGVLVVLLVLAVVAAPDLSIALRLVEGT